MQKNCNEINFQEEMRNMTISQTTSLIHLWNHTGKYFSIDTRKLTLLSSGQIFSSKINKLKAVENNEILACAESGEIFYGKMGGNSKHGISIKNQNECFDIDVSEFIIACGSTKGQISIFIYNEL